MNTEKLISLVFERKPLWDQSTLEYHNRDVSRRLWKEIAGELNESCEVVKSKWRGLRDNFRKEMVKCYKYSTGDSAGSYLNSKWAYFELMSFLKNNMVNRSGNIQLSQTERVDSEQIQVIPSLAVIINEHDESSDSEVVTRAVPKQPPSKKLKRDESKQLVEFEEKVLEICQENSNRKSDSHYHFLMSLLPELKKIPSHRQLHVRIRLQQVLLEEQQHEQL